MSEAHTSATKRRYRYPSEERTDTPGVYKRHKVYRVVWRPEGDHRETRTFQTYEEARTFKLSIPRRQRVARRASYLRRDPCSYCGLPSETLDHIIPRFHGGANDWSNLTAACRPCNSAKRERPLLLFLLRREPESETPDGADLFVLLKR